MFFVVVLVGDLAANKALVMHLRKLYLVVFPYSARSPRANEFQESDNFYPYGPVFLIDSLINVSF